MKKALKWTVIGIIWLGIWFLASFLAGNEVYFASPVSTFKTLLSLFGEEDFFSCIFTSLLRILAGFIIGSFAGDLGAALSYKSSLFKDFSKPAVSLIKATPVASFIILALVFFNKSNIPVLTSALIVLPVTWSNIYSGFNSVDKKLIELAGVYKLSFKAKLLHIYIPSVLPYFKAAVTSGLGMAWKAGIAAEVIANPNNSIGAALFDAKIYLETDRLFAWTLIVILLSVLFEKIAVKLINKIGERKKHA